MRVTFPGPDPDNGSESIDQTLVAYRRCWGITFSRSRPYKRNDNTSVGARWARVGVVEAHGVRALPLS